MTLTDQEIDVLRAMTPAQKLTVMHALIRQAYQLKAAAITERRPDLSQAEVEGRVRTLVGGAGS
jgi:hypothetical protein